MESLGDYDLEIESKDKQRGREKVEMKDRTCY